MTSPGGNVVEIRVVVRDQSGPGFDAAMRKAKGLAAAVAGGPQSAAGAMKEAERQASGLGGTLRRVGEVAGGVLVAGVVQQMSQRAVALVKSTAQAASGLGESLNAVNKTFEEGSQDVLNWGKANANALGMSQRAFNQSATVLGAMLKNQGLALGDVTDHTTKLAERAADMASVFNTDVSDALAAIQAGLRGEIDPLERYGVSLSAAAVEQRALADTGKTATSELTAQDKALARLAVLYEQTDDVAGDFRDTSDGMANAQRIATAQIEDAQAKIGTAFMPIMAKASQVTGELAEKFANLPGPLQAVMVVVIGLGGAIGLLAPKALAAKAALDSMAMSGSAVQRGMAKATIAIGKATAGLVALQLAGAAVGQILGDDITPEIDALAVGLDRFAKTGEAGGEFARLFGDDLRLLERDFRQVQDPVHGAAKAIENFFMVGGVSDSHNSSEARIAAIDQALARMVSEGKAEEAAAQLEALVNWLGQQGVEVEDLQKLLPAYSGALEVGAAKTDKVAEAAEEAARELDDLDKEFNDIFDSTFGFEEAQDRAADAVARLIEQLERQRAENEAGAGALTGNTQAARDNRDAVRDLVKLYEDLMIEAHESGQSVDGLRQELEDQLVEMGFARDEAKRYTDSLLTLEGQLAKIKSKDVTVRVFQETHGRLGTGDFFGSGIPKASGGIQGAAGGGPRGNMTLVGEHGPELVDLAPGSMVHSAGDTMRMMSGAGAPVEIMLSIKSSGNALIDRILNEIAAEVQIRGGDASILGIRTVG